MNSANNFTWVPTYKAITDYLKDKKQDQIETGG